MYVDLYGDYAGATMKVCSFTDLREHLREHLDQLHDTREPLLVTRQNAPSAVLLDKSEYDGLMETLHLLQSPVNAALILNGIAELDAGMGEQHDLIEP